MKSKPTNQGQMSLMSPHLSNICDPRHPYSLLADRIPWEVFEEEFDSLYSPVGQPAKPVRLMVGLLILKQMENLGDETVVQKWVENPYFQYFCGEADFQWKFPCDPSDLVHFRKRIGKKGIEKILQVSIAVHGKKALEKEILVDSTVQEKNITFPTDSKLYRRISEQCVKLASKEGVKLRRSYSRTLKKLVMDQRFRSHPKNRKKANKATRKLKTIAGRLVRELERKLPKKKLKLAKDKLDIFKRILGQKKKDKNKLYSLHELDISCMSKGKEHKKYEFGSKVSIAMTRDSGIIVGAMSFSSNPYDGHTLPDVLEQVESLRGVRPKAAICDRGYRGKSKVGKTQILIPKSPGKRTTNYQKTKARQRFRRRAGIEPIIGHLKQRFGLGRNYLKGIEGDEINAMLSAAAFNFKKLMKALAFLFDRWLIRKMDQYRRILSSKLAIS